MPAPSRVVYLLVVPGFADWEPAHGSRSCAATELGVLSEADRGVWLDLFRGGRLPPDPA